MKIRIDSQGFEVDGTLYEHTEQQVKRLAERFALSCVNVTLSLTSEGEPLVEIAVRGNEIDLRFEERGADMYGAVPRIVERIEQRLLRHRDDHTLF